MQLTEEQRLIQQTVNKFTESELLPLAERMDAESYWPEDLFPKFGELGILGPTISEEYGGLGSNPLTQVLIIEELSRVGVGVGISYLAHANLCAHNIYKNGNNIQRSKYLPPLCAGEKVGALALTEPGAGSDAMGIQTTAVRDGDCYRLNGNKMFITNAPNGDVFLVYAKTDKAAGAHGITAFIVEKGFEGFSVSRKLKKLGAKCSPTGELVLDNCLVPVENVIGEENKGVTVTMSGLDIERVMVAACALGVAQAAFTESLKYSKEREQFGRPIADFQLIQAKLADMFTYIEAARLLTYDTAVRIEHEAKLRKESAAAALFSCEMASKVCTEAVQIHGGYGYMDEFHVSRLFRDIKLLEIGAGTSEIRRLLIAAELLK